MTTNDLKLYVYDSDDYDDLTIEEQKRLDIEMAKSISRKECSDRNINVSLIAYNELGKLGFKDGLPTYYLSKLIESLYHERKEFDSSNYFDLSMEDNEHYKELFENYDIKDEKFYRAMVATAIGNSSCEIKNINDLAYIVVSDVSKEISQKTMKLA